jgi:hypothetical protein
VVFSLVVAILLYVSYLHFANAALSARLNAAKKPEQTTLAVIDDKIQIGFSTICEYLLYFGAAYFFWVGVVTPVVIDDINTARWSIAVFRTLSSVLNSFFEFLDKWL